MSAIAGALISGGASLLGGLFGRSSASKQQARQNEYNKPINIRKRAEEGGFNPLLWAGQGNIQMQPGPSGIMGSAIANAGLALADGMSEQRQLDLERTKLKQDQERLDALIEKQTIRPKVGGIYAGSQQTPSVARAPGRPLMNGAPQPGSAPVFNPPTEYNPIPDDGPRLQTKVMRSDGMTSADPENPAEMEGDWWTWAREGTFWQNNNEILRRNTPETLHYKGRDALFPKMIDGARKAHKKAQEDFEKNPPKRRKLKGVNPNLNDKKW